MRRVLAILIFVAAAASPVVAQKAFETNNITTTAARASLILSLPADVALEVELQQTKESLTQAQNDLAAMRVQFTALSKVLDEFLAAEARPRIQSVLESRKAIEAKAITALGGDPGKDAFDWTMKTLIRKDVKK